MLLYILGLLVLGFILLSAFIVLLPPCFIDLHISEEIQERNSVFFDSVMKFISWFGNIYVSVPMVCFTSFLFFIATLKKEALFTVLTLISGIISSALKLLFNRPRPTDHLVRIVEKAKQQSFPSGHTLFYTIFFGLMIIIMCNLKDIPKWFRILVISVSVTMILSIPISRGIWARIGLRMFSEDLY